MTIFRSLGNQISALVSCLFRCIPFRVWNLYCLITLKIYNTSIQLLVVTATVIFKQFVIILYQLKANNYYLVQLYFL